MSSNTSYLADYETDPRLFLFTSLTAGSSHIITATSRMETILKANRIPFQAIDLATDEKAKKLFQRRGQKKKLPCLVKDGFVIGDLEEVEEWSEFGELKENIGPVPASNVAPAGSSIVGVSTAPAINHNVPGPVNTGAAPSLLNRPIPPPVAGEETRIALPGAAEIAALNKAKKEKEAAAKAAAQASTTTTDVPASTTPAATASVPEPVKEEIAVPKDAVKETSNELPSTAQAASSASVPAVAEAPDTKPETKVEEAAQPTKTEESSSEPALPSTTTTEPTIVAETSTLSNEASSKATLLTSPVENAKGTEIPALEPVVPVETSEKTSEPIASEPSEETTGSGAPAETSEKTTGPVAPVETSEQPTEPVSTSTGSPTAPIGETAKEALPAETQKEETTIPEDKTTTKDDDVNAATKGIEALQVNESDKTQEQDPKEGADASKSVED